jgi:hypothetical protein
VEARFSDGTWDICDFLTGHSYANTNFHKAHLLKRRIALYLNPKNSDGIHNWKKEDFRVREYRILKEDQPLPSECESKYCHKRLIRVANEIEAKNETR